MIKPPYRVPSMAEIAAVPWNGFLVASTFAGAGGSSLGYRMAGFRVAWASEFVPAAREVYALNAAPGTVIDDRDVRVVQPAEILAATGLAVGELDVLDGSPPCASFSTAGKRQAHWGQVRKYSDVEQRTDDLFFEFARVRDGLMPKAFVAENVSGLVKGAAKGYFLEILAKLKKGYRVEARMLDAQWLGVPQQRQRIIFVGVREDLGIDPAFPVPLPYRYSVREAIPWIASFRNPVTLSGFGKGPIKERVDQPSQTIMVDGLGASNDYAVEVEHEADIGAFAIGREADKLAPGQQSDKYFQLVRAPLDGPCPTVSASGGGCDSYAGLPTNASVIHPTERRKFSIAELRRVCGFPDDFALTGTYGQQWERLGRAVPPPMMRALAEAIRDQVLGKIGKNSSTLVHPRAAAAPAKPARGGRLLGNNG
jgi:DNA (cytosine-5)-methyltransferase 1